VQLRRELGGRDQGPSLDFARWADKTEKKRGGLKEKGLTFFSKVIQTNEFKYQLEFKQPKIMCQHVCNKLQAIYLIYKKQIIFFFMYYIPCKVLNVEKSSKLWENHCLIFLPIHIQKLEKFRV
jgi:hypothetical protein